MGIIESLFGSGLKREGEGLPAPSSGYKLYFYLLWNYFWKISAANLLFVVFSIPLITMPASLCSINRVYIKLIREGHVFVWDEFITEFRKSFKKSLGLGIIFGLLLFTAYYLLSLGLTNSMNLYGLVFSGLGIFIVAFSGIWGGYSFALTAVCDLPVKIILRNSLSLMILQGSNSLGVLASEAFLIFLIVALFPVSLLLFITCLAGVIQFTVCFLINGPLEKYIIPSPPG